MESEADDLRNRRIDAAVAEYLEARERGQPPDQEAFLARHSDIADELRRFLVDCTVFHRAGKEAAAALTTDGQAHSTGPAAAVAGQPLKLPRLFGNFELLEEIARGGMGVVYKARQATPSRLVALKMILSGQLAAQTDVDRFYAEAQAAAALDHPMIVPIFQVGQEQGQHYFTMGYVAGESLAQRLIRGPLPPREAATIIRDVASAVQYAHDSGIVHRDVKPANVLLDSRGGVRVTDFGLAKRQADENGLTCTGQLLGTPSFMSPEQAVGGAGAQTIGPPSDVYSLGATLYALLAGRPPFQAANVIDTLNQVREQDPVPPRQIDASIPRDLETIALKCLEKYPSRRYASAQALAEDLDRVLADEPIHARRATRAERLVRWGRRNPAIAALGTAVAALMVAAVVILAVSNAQIRRASAGKDAALATAYDAVDRMLTEVAGTKLDDVPRAQPLRVALFEDAAKLYADLFKQAPGDANLGQRMAEVLNMLGDMQKELGQIDEARQSLERSLEIRQRLVDGAVDPFTARERMARTEEDLAVILRQPGTDDADREAETHFRRALEIDTQLEREQPERRQLVAGVLHNLAELAVKRGDKPSAERLWREAIAKGHAYLEQQPADLRAQLNVCWASAELDEHVLSQRAGNSGDVEEVLNTGLRHYEAALALAPGGMSVREAGAFLHFCMARHDARRGKLDAAVEFFRQAVDENETLCAEFPWNPSYWDTTQYFHESTVRILQRAGRRDDARMAADHMAEWFKQTAPKIPDEPGAQARLAECRTSLVALLRATSQQGEADELAKTGL